MTTLATMPAFPCTDAVCFAGLNKREHFAALAMQALIAEPDVDFAPEYTQERRETIALEAVLMADVLIDALSRTTYSEDRP